MNLLRNALAVLLGLIVGGGVNMGLVVLGPIVIAPPAGVDVTDPDAMAAAIEMFEARHFVFPFLAHALGTLVGALLASLVAATHRTQLALVIGVFFLAGGVTVATMIPAPAWFIAMDLVLAYLPAAWIGLKAGELLRPSMSYGQARPS